MPLLSSLLLGLNSLRPAFLDAVLAPGLPRHGGAWAGPAKAQLLCLPVAFLCLNPVSLPAMRELAPGLFVSSPALGPFLWGDASSLLGRLLDLWLGLRYLRLGRLLDLRLPGRFGLCFLWRRDVYGVLESMAFTEVRPHSWGVCDSRPDSGNLNRGITPFVGGGLHDSTVGHPDRPRYIPIRGGVRQHFGFGLYVLWLRATSSVIAHFPGPPDGMGMV